MRHPLLGRRSSFLRALQLPLLSALAALAAPSVAPLRAQIAVDFHGRIVALTPPICSTEVTHSVECTKLHLRSSTIALEQYRGQIVAIKGTLSLLQCPVVDVTEVLPASARTSVLSLSSYRLGAPIVWTTTAPIGALVGLYLSMDRQFLPLGELGALTVDPLGGALIGVLPSITVAVHIVQVPNDPALLGWRFYTQAFAANLLAQPMELRLLNPTCFQLRQ